MQRLVVLPVAAALLLSACASVPTGPSVMVLPGTGKNFEQFQGDDAVCRDWALQQTGTTANKTAVQNTVGGAAVGTVVGAALGAAIGAAAGAPATGAAVGAGAGLLGGTTVGAGNAYGASVSVQRRYDMAYLQCMYLKGNQVPTARGSRPAYTAAPPPPPPAPPSAAVAPPSSVTPPGVPPPPPGMPPPPPSGPAR
jgi:uncharacterized protein YcfJ